LRFAKANNKFFIFIGVLALKQTDFIMRLKNKSAHKNTPPSYWQRGVLSFEREKTPRRTDFFLLGRRSFSHVH